MNSFEDPSDLNRPNQTKETLANLIANTITRVAATGSVRGLNLLLAALVLLQSSNGKDNMMASARKLAIRGATMRDPDAHKRY